jgi:hypothetical protein
MRSFQHPRGLPVLSKLRRRKVLLANALSDFTVEASAAQVETSPGLLVIESPEDLGAVRNGRHRGERPATIWHCCMARQVVHLAGRLLGRIQVLRG